MNFYELISEIYSSRLDYHWDNLPHSFNQSNRSKLKNVFDLEIFDIVKKTYRLAIIYRSDRTDSDANNEYRINSDEGIITFTENSYS